MWKRASWMFAKAEEPDGANYKEAKACIRGTGLNVSELYLPICTESTIFRSAIMRKAR